MRQLVYPHSPYESKGLVQHKESIKLRIKKNNLSSTRFRDQGIDETNIVKGKRNSRCDSSKIKDHNISFTQLNLETQNEVLLSKATDANICYIDDTASELIKDTVLKLADSSNGKDHGRRSNPPKEQDAKNKG